MKKTIFYFSILALLSFFLTSCAPDLEDINGNKLWLENECFEPTGTKWTYFAPNYKMLTLERLSYPTEVPGPYIECLFFIFDGQNDTIPLPGKYGCNTYHPDSLTKNFMVHINRYEGFGFSGNDSYLADTTQTNSFEISSINGNNISGKVSCYVYNEEYPEQKKLIKASFENVGYQ